MAAAMAAARRWRCNDGGTAMAAAMAGARGGVDGRGMSGEEEKTVALCGARNLASTRCEEGSGLCVKHPFLGDTA